MLPIIEAIEARLLYSATLDVVLVDSHLADQELLNAAATDADSYILFDSQVDSAEDIIAEVTRWAEAHEQKIDSLSIFSHGSEGSFTLGNETVTATAVNGNQSDLWQQLGEVLDDDANIYLYGCDVGDGEQGQQLLDALAEAAGADVFASDDVTGHGGDWQLEVASQGDEAELAGLATPVNIEKLSQYQYSLASYGFVGGSSYSGNWANDTNLRFDDGNEAEGDPGEEVIIQNFGLDAELSGKTLYSIDGFEVKFQVETFIRSPEMDFYLSGDGGATWTSAKYIHLFASSSETRTMGDGTDTWGKTWSASEVTDANFQLKVIARNYINSTITDTSEVDYFHLKLHYTEDIAPVANNLTINQVEVDAGIALALSATDANAGDNIEAYRIDSLPANGALYIDGVEVTTVGATVTQAQVSSNLLTFEPSDNNWNGTTSFSFSASDGQLWSDSSATVTITLTPVDDAPVNHVPGTQFVFEDNALIFSTANSNAITVENVDNATGKLKVTLSVTNGTLTLNAAQTGPLSFSDGDGSNDTTMTFTGTAAEINSALEGLRFDPNLDYFGTANISLQTTDIDTNPLDNDATAQAIYNMSDTSDTLGNHAAITLNGGASLTTDVQRGDIVSVDGVDDYVALPAGATPTGQAFSVSFWVKTTESRTGSFFYEQPALFGFDNFGAGNDLLITTNNGYIGLAQNLNAGGDHSNLSTTVQINDDQWHLITVTNDGDKARLYVDGTEEVSLVSETNNQLLSGQFFLGAQNDGTAAEYFHQGEFDEVRLFDRALSAGEIADIYNGPLSSTSTINITVDRDDAPVINDAVASNLSENAANGTFVYNVNTTGGTSNDTDADGTAVNYSISSGNDDGIFTIDPSTGEITVLDNSLLNYETTSSYVLTVAASDGGFSDTANITINVSDINEVPSLSLSNTVTSLSEGADTSSRIKVADITINDDAPGTNVLTLVGADATKFEIDANALYLKAGEILDFETNNILEVTVQVDDSGVGATPDDTASLSITLSDANEAPGLSLSNTITSLAENIDTTNRVKVADISVIDDALGTETLSLGGTDAGQFEIIGNALYLKAGESLDFESNATLDVSVQVDDSSVGSTPDAIVALSINVTNVNEIPAVSLSNTVTSLVENSDTSSRIKVADIVVSDDSLGTNVLTLAGGDAAKFEILGDALYLKAGELLDFETATTLQVSVHVDDGTIGASPDDTAALTISLTDVNELPSVSLSNTVTSLSEGSDTSSRIKVADISVADDALGANNLTLAGSDAIKFEIDSGALYLKAGESLDFESNAILDVVVQVDDVTIGATPDSTAALSIALTDTNETPSVSLSNTVTNMAENSDTSSRIKVADITISDDALGTNLLTLTGTDAAKFEILGNALYLKAGESLDFESDSVLNVTVQVDDNTVGAMPDDTATLSINLNDVNEIPAISLSNTVTNMAEDTNTSSRIKVADIIINDDALGTNTLSLTGSEAAKFEIDSGALYLKAGESLDFETQASLAVTVQVDDTGVGATPDDTAALSITLTDANETPTVSLTNTITSLAENTDTSSRIKVADISIVDDALGSNLLALSGVDAAKFEIDAMALYLRAGESLDFETNGVLDVVVQVDDSTVGANPDDIAALSIILSDVNETPSISLSNTVTSLAENIDTSSRIKVADISVSDDALGSNTLTLVGADASKFEIDSGALYLKAGETLDFETNANLDVTVQVDDVTVGATPDDTAALSITLTDSNEAPSVSLSNTVTTLAENSDTSSRIKVADISVSDDALGTNGLTLIGADATKFEIDSGALYLKAGESLDFESNGTLDVTVQVDDLSIGVTPDDTATLSIVLTDVNEVPSVSLTNTVTSLVENIDTSSRLKVADIIISDDALGTNDLTLTGADAAKFEIDSGALYLRAGESLNFEAQVSLAVAVQVDDVTVGATPDDTAALNIAVTDVNEAPSVSLSNTITSLAENTDTSSRIKVADITISDDALGANTLTLMGADATKFEVISTELYLKAGESLDFESNGTLDVTVQVDDATVGTTPDDTAALSIVLTDVNEAPSVSLSNTVTSLAENSDTSSRIKVADISISDDALGTNALTLIGADAIKFEIVSDALYLKAGESLDFESNGILDVTVQVDDASIGGAVDDSAALSISLTDVNEAPVVSLSNAVSSLAENTDTSTRLKVADITVDDDALGANALTLAGDDVNKFEIDSGALYLKAGESLDFESNGTLDVIVQVDDPAIGVTPDNTAALSIVLTDVNEVPSVSLTNTVTSLVENSDTSSRVKVADITISDDALGTNTLTLTGNDAAKFEIVSNALYLKAGESLDFEINASLDVAVQVDDNTVGGTPDGTAGLTIALTDINEIPQVNLSNAISSLIETTDTSSRIKVADVVISDDGLGINTLSLVGTDAAQFELDGNELFLSAGTVLDNAGNPVLDVTVRVDDISVGGTPDDSATLSLNVVLGAVPVLGANALTINEGETVVLSPGDLSATDSDTDDNTLTFTVSAVNQGQFERVSNTGIAINNFTQAELIAGDIQFVHDGGELAPSYSVIVGDANYSSPVTAATITFSANVNDVPSVSLTNTVTSLPENSDTTTRIKVADITISDDALGTNTLTLTGSDATKFEIDSNVLYLKAGESLDFETNGILDVAVDVDDNTVGANPDGSAALSISLTDVNETPVVSLTNTVVGLAENTDTSSRIKVADITITDDALGSNTLALTGSDATKFEIDSGALYLRAGESLDFETNASLAVVVQVDDNTVGASPDDTATLNIALTDVNEIPSVSLSNTVSSLSENTDTSSRIKVADITIGDDALGVNALTLIGSDASVFEIDSGALYIKAGESLDFETNATLDVTVQVDDNTVGANPDDTASLSITLSDVNELPTVSLSNTVTNLAENTDTSSRIKVADITINDDALGTNGLTLAGSDASMFEIDSGALYLSAGELLDFDNNNILDVNVQVDDSSIGSNPDDIAALSINLTDTNGLPTVSLSNTVTSLAENADTSSRLKVADITIDDDALGVNGLTLAGSDAAKFEIDSGALYLRAGESLDFETDASLDVTVQVDDNTIGGNPDDTASLNIALSDANEAPSVSLTNTVTNLLENIDTSNRIKVADIAISDDALGTNVLTLAGSDAAKFEIDGSSLYLRAGESLDFETNGSLNVAVEVDDGSIGVTPDDTAALTINLNDVNEVPSVSLSNTVTLLAENTDTSSRVKVADINLNDDALGANVLNLVGADATKFEIDSGALYLKAGESLNFETNNVLDVTVQVDDNTVGMTPDDTATLSITLLDVNELPTVSLANTVTSLAENTDTSSRIKVADINISDDALGVNALTLAGVDAVMFEIDSGALYLKAGESLDFETNGTLDVIVQVDDNTIGMVPDDTASLSIVLGDTNEVPSISLTNTVTSLVENSDTSSRIKVADITVSDDALGSNLLTLSGADAAKFEIDAMALYLRAGESLDFETNSILNVSIQVDDNTVGTSPDDTAHLIINLTDANELPSVNLSNTVTQITENTDTSTRIKVADINISDDALGSNLLTLAGADASKFEIDSNVLYLKAGELLNFESNPALDVTVQVDDNTIGVSPDDTASLTIALMDANEQPSVSLSNTVTALAENVDVSSRIKVADITISDDALGSNMLTLSGADALKFEIDGVALYLKAGESLDFETNSVLNVIVQVDDSAIGANPDDTAVLDIVLGDINELPSVSLSNTVTLITESTDTSSRIKVADITINDDALGSNTLTLTGSDAAKFDIDSGALYLKAGESLDFETNGILDVTVQVDDNTIGVNPDDAASLSITLSDANEIPSVSLNNTVTNLLENIDTSSRTKVADITISDDALGSNVLTLVGADATQFEIFSGALYLKAGEVLDFETNSTLEVTVQVDDNTVGATPDDTASLSIALGDTNEAPAINLSNSVTVLPEDTNTSSRIKVADIIISDDALGVNALSLQGSDAGLFEIDSAALYLQAGVVLDNATNPVLDVVVNVDDGSIGGNPDDTAALSIAITFVDMNTATIVNDSVSLSEGTAVTLSTVELSANDIDTDNTSLIYTVGNVSQGSLVIKGAVWDGVTNNSFTQQDIIDGLIQYTHDGTNTTADSFSFSVADPIGHTLNSQTFSITITPVDDDVAAITNNTGIAVDEEGIVSLSITELSATDTDSIDVDLVYTVANVSHGNLIINGSPWASVSNQTFTQQDILDGNVRYQHDGSDTTVDSFVFSVEDSAGNQLSNQQFNISINPINDVPTTVGLATQNILEDFETYTIDLATIFADSETASGDLNYSVSGNQDIGVAIDDNGIATVSNLSADWSGTEMLSFTASDGEHSVTTSANFDVSSVNDAPQAALLPDQNLTSNFDAYTIDLKLLFTDAETSDDELDYGVEGNDNIDIHIDDNGVATVQAISSLWSGTEAVVFSAMDAQGAIVRTSASFVVSSIHNFINDPADLLPNSDDETDDTPLVDTTDQGTGEVDDSDTGAEQSPNQQRITTQGVEVDDGLPSLSDFLSINDVIPEIYALQEDELISGLLEERDNVIKSSETRVDYDAIRLRLLAGDEIYTRSFLQSDEGFELLKSNFELWRQLDDIDDQVTKESDRKEVVIQTIKGAGVMSFSVLGIWILRAAALSSSMFAAVPAWRSLDPVAVLRKASDEKDSKDKDPYDDWDEDVDPMFQSSKNTKVKS